MLCSWFNLNLNHNVLPALEPSVGGGQRVEHKLSGLVERYPVVGEHRVRLGGVLRVLEQCSSVQLAGLDITWKTVTGMPASLSVATAPSNSVRAACSKSSAASPCTEQPRTCSIGV